MELHWAHVEWLQLEKDDDQTVDEWIRRVVHLELRERQLTNHGANIDATADVSEDFARRVELYAESRGLTDPHSTETVALNHIKDWGYEWTVEGELWEAMQGARHRRPMPRESWRVRGAILTDRGRAWVTSVDSLAEILQELEFFGPDPEGVVVEMDQSAIEELPPGWRWCRLAEA